MTDELLAAHLRDLVERCETGEVGNELDDDLHGLLPEPKVIQPPRYTRSIDAALKLLPKGADWRRLTHNSVSVYAANPYNAQAQKRIDGYGKTAPLQMCAAALKLRLAPLEKALAAAARRLSA